MGENTLFDDERDIAKLRDDLERERAAHLHTVDQRDRLVARCGELEQQIREMHVAGASRKTDPGTSAEAAAVKAPKMSPEMWEILGVLGTAPGPMTRDKIRDELAAMRNDPDLRVSDFSSRVASLKQLGFVFVVGKGVSARGAATELLEPTELGQERLYQYQDAAKSFVV